jgi:hypothetical protein
MSYIPEDFHWDGVLFSLKCEVSYLINALMPLPIQKVEELTNKLQVFPVIFEKDLSYKKRLDLEKKLEHLPLKIFWCPTGQFTLYHFQHFAIKMGLDKSLFPYKKVNESLDSENYLWEQNNYEKLFQISDFSFDYEEDHFLHGLTQTLELQNIFNKSDLLSFINIVNSHWSNIWAHAFDQTIIMSACQISYCSIGNAIELRKDEHVNLIQGNTFSEDFHLILPDYLVRGIYCKLVQSNRTNISKIMNPDTYQQSIFSMAEIIYILTNNWIKLKEFPEIFLLKYDPKIIGQNNEKIEIKNHASGSGFLATWKLEIEGLPLHKFSMFFSLEMVEQLLPIT